MAKINNISWKELMQKLKDNFKRKGESTLVNVSLTNLWVEEDFIQDCIEYLEAVGISHALAENHCTPLEKLAIMVLLKSANVGILISPKKCYNKNNETQTEENGEKLS